MTEQDLAAMEVLAAKATKVPWQAGDGSQRTFLYQRRQVFSAGEKDGRLITGSLVADCYQHDGCDNANFMAAARQFVPAAIAELRRMREELSYLRSTGATHIE